MSVLEQCCKEIQVHSKRQRTFIWGAGNTAVLNHQGMLREDLYNYFCVEAFIDAKLAGTSFNTFPVYSPNILDSLVPDETFILICTTNPRVFHEIEQHCNEKGISNCLFDAAVLKVCIEKYLDAAALMDPTSQQIYKAVLQNRSTATEADELLYGGESYFGIPEFCRSRHDDIVVDCGAYVGDSAERFIWRMEQFEKYIAIEPDKGNYEAMVRRFERLNREWNFLEGKLSAIFGGVDAVSSIASIESRVDGLGSIAVDNADGGVEFWAIDDLIQDRVSFLKADIESYEYRMLCGAKGIIKKYRPRMAICIYHNMVDMFSIPLLIHSIDPTYRLSVRHHSYGYEETVLYAY